MKLQQHEMLAACVVNYMPKHSPQLTKKERQIGDTVLADYSLSEQSFPTMLEAEEARPTDKDSTIFPTAQGRFVLVTFTKKGES